MATPIRKLFIVKRYREAFYQLSAEAREAGGKRIEDAEASVGARGLINCRSTWCNEAILSWGVNEYPDIQAVQRLCEFYDKEALSRYVDTETYLGTGGETMNETVDIPGAIYQLFMIRNVNNEPGALLPKEKWDAMWKRQEESFEKNGGKPMFWSNVTWSNEEYANFGVIAWPSVEALQAHFAVLEEIGWHRYVYARSILGTKMD